MKRLSYIAISALLAVLSAACTVPLEESSLPVEEDMGTATFTFTPHFNNGPETKAMSLLPYDPDDPSNHSTIKNIFFAVFDAEGYKLAEYAEAVPNSYAEENGTPYSYSVKLTVTNDKRIVHIIANAPESLKYGTEEEVIGSLCTYLDAPETGEYDRQDAYWERIVLENGVHAEPDIALKTDNPAEYDRLFEKYKEVRDTLSTARLTRNFASIAVVKNTELTDDKFMLTGFMLVNVPDRGSIAPYNRNLEQFQQNYGHWGSIASMIGDGPDDGNYQGFTPAGAQIRTYSELTEAQLHARMKNPTSENVCEFCYEREVPKADPLYIIIAGKYNGSTSESYYKIDLKDQENHYFPILRNFHYRINIQNVTAAGAPSIKAALEGLPTGGDISTSLDLQSLTNISNGEAQLIVSSTEEVIVDVDGVDDYILWFYKFVPDVTYPDVTENQPFQLAYNTPEEIAELERRKAAHEPYLMFDYQTGETGNVIRGLTLTDDGTDGYQCVKFIPEAPGDIVKTSVTTLTGYYWSSVSNKYESISRSVRFILRKKLEMKLDFLPEKVPNNTNQDLDLRIGIEAGLPQSVFSLDLQIEAQKRSLSANITEDNHEELPVSTGNSSIPGHNEPAFWFTKTITYEDYTNAPVVSTEDGDFKFFTCHFKTLKAVDYDDVYVSNPLFVQNHARYTMFTGKEFRNLNYSASNPEVGDDLTFSFDLEALPSDGKVMVSMLGMETSSGESQLVYKYSDDEGYEVYEMSVSQTHNSIAISPYAAGTATIKLDADEFLTALKDVTVNLAGSSQYSIVENAINLYRINNAYNFGNGATVSVYYTDPRLSSISHPAKTFTTNSNNRNSAFSIYAVAGRPLYFSINYNGDVYYASALIDDLAAARNTTTARYDLVFNTDPAIRIIEAQSVTVSRVNTSLAFSSGATVNVYDTDPQSGSAVAIKTFTVNDNKRNSEFTIPQSLTGTLYFSTEYLGETYYAQVGVNELDAATTTSRYDLVFNTNPPKRIIDGGSVQFYSGATGTTNFGSGRTINVFASDPATGTAIATITTDSNSRNSEFSISSDVSQLWFTSSDGVNNYQAGPVSAADVDNATNANNYRYVVRMITDSPTWTLETGSIRVQRGGANWGNANVSYYFSDPKSGSPAQIGTFSTNSNGNNNSNVAITCPAGTTIYFKATYSYYSISSTTYYGSASIEALNNATATNSGRYILNLTSN